MVFQSLEFVGFFAIVFILYYAVSKNLKLQNWVLLIASYIFYGIAEWKMIPLLLIATAVFYILGIAIERENGTDARKASALTALSVVVGVGMLVYFKYLNFFIDSFAGLLSSMGLKCNIHTFNIIMPLGVSFFTFRLLSYTIEIHRQKMSACKDFIAFATYISFFPCILSGPIDRPKAFLEQIKNTRTFDYNTTVSGMRMILWGLFKKLVVADTLAMYVDAVWGNIEHHNGTTLLVASILYTINLYADFSGYSDMAVGIGRMLGINVMINFKQPFFSRNIAEYWRSWHISLTTWFRDYIYIPLGGSRCSKRKIVRNTFIIFLASGFWHGANWTFIAWGAYHAVLFLPLVLLGKNRKYKEAAAMDRTLPTLKETGQILLTFLLAVFGWIIFRSESVSQAFDVYTKIFTDWGSLYIDKKSFFSGLFFSLFIFITDFFDKFHPEKLLLLNNDKIVVRWFCYVSLITIILLFGSLEGGSFIYFQF